MRFSRKTVFLFALLVVAASALAVGLRAEPIKFARTPHIGGGKIAFSYHGDIWVANEDGSSPVRLTDHVARDTYPKFSPDGRWIAFTSDRMGNDDLFLIPVSGGEARQLTFHTSGDTLLNWTPDGKRLIFATSLVGTWGSPLYTVDLEGGLPEPMDMDTGAAGMVSQDGRFLAFNRRGFRYWRKHYRGNANTDIYLQDLATKKITQLTDLDMKEFRNHRQDAFPMWGADGMIYFMSERDGIFNIWKVSPRGGQPVQVTFHKKDGVQYPSASADGKTIVYENEFEIWRLDVPDGAPRKIPVEIAFDNKQNLVEFLHVDSEVDGFSPAPDGRYLAVDTHGEIFLVPTNAEIGEKTQVTASPWRDRYANYSPDGRFLCYVSDGSLEEEVWLYDLQRDERRKLTTHESFKGPTLWSKDSKRIAFTAANRIFIVDAVSGTAREAAHNPAMGFTLDDWSKDGRWLLYSRTDETYNSDVFLFDLEEKKEHNITVNPFRDRSGELTPDGKTVVFLSSRDGGTAHLFAVSLARITEDPNDPLVREKLEKQKKAAAKREPEGTGPAGSGISLDLAGIDRRAVQLTRGENAVGSFFLSDDGKKIYYTGRDDKGPGLFVVDIDGKNGKKIGEGAFSNLSPSADRKAAFFRRESGVFKMDLPSGKPERVRFSLTVTVDKRREWTQMFEECWRVMKYRFYDENMHGFDWAAIRETYRPLLKSVGENRDLYDLTNEMIGELNASHTGVSGPTGDRPRTYATRYPGFEMEPHGGFYRVSHIYWDGPADKEWVDLRAGDYVLAIDGHDLKAGDNYWKILNQTLNDYVTLKVNGRPETAGARTVRIRTVPSLSGIKYEEWVKNNRDVVEKATNGEIAYVHIRSMNRPSLERFQNEISRFSDRKGLIVDIRYNGGGNIDQELLDILERRPYEFWNNRWGTRSMGRRPRQAIVGPKVMLINWRSASDSEVTPMGFRDLGLGRIVGNPTNGSVIATGSYRLINGGSIRTPGSLVVTWDPTKPNNYGINLENYGVAPDVWAENTPEDELKGFDRELRAAIDEVLRMLKERE
jgi:tricorn protease